MFVSIIIYLEGKNNIDETGADRLFLSQIDVNQSDEISALDSVVTDSIQRTLEVLKIK